MNAFFDGLLYGLIFVFWIGPAFFALLQTALKSGLTRAMSVSIGVIMADAILIVLILLGFASLLENESIRFWLGIIGVGALLVFGISSWLKTRAISTENAYEGGSVVSYWLKGLAINILNPLMIIFWIGAISTVSAMGYDRTELFSFFGGFLITAVLLDLMKVLLIGRWAHLITKRTMMIVNRVIGSIFIVFGLRLLYFILVGD